MLRLVTGAPMLTREITTMNGVERGVRPISTPSDPDDEEVGEFLAGAASAIIDHTELVPTPRPGA